MASSNPMDHGYITVAERHAKFVEDHPKGAIITDLAYAHDGLVIVKASVWKDRATMDDGKGPDGTGIASMPIPGPTNFTKNSEAENAETSALGRALAMIGYHPKETMASSDEIAAKAGDDKPKARSTRKTTTSDEAQGVTDAQLRGLMARARDAGMNPSEDEGKAALQKFVADTVKKHSTKDLTSSDIDILYRSLDELAEVLKATNGVTA